MAHNHFQTHSMLHILMFFLILHSAASQSPDVDAMQKLKKNLHFRTIIWNNKDPCQWEHVQCTNGNVVSIQLGWMAVRGELPDSINQLKSLQILDLRHNNLYGPLPTFSGMSSLKTLLLNNNYFTRIPDDFFKGMTALETVALDMNPFEQWQIPPYLIDIVGLKSFSAISANIVGKIPAYLGMMKANLTTLRLSFNYLEGELPVEFSGSSIQSLWLDRQLSQPRMTGSIDVLSNMTALVDVWLHYNNFEGVIPDVSKLTKLEDFSVSNNKLFGPVPESLVASSSLKKVSLENNLLQSKMPKFRNNIEVENGGNNKYCSSTLGADCDQNVRLLWNMAAQLKLAPQHFKNWDGNDVCGWNGITCDSSRKNVTVISFQNMNLVGTIPPELANFTSLERLYLQNNNLTGTIPATFSGLPNLIFIDVASNNVSEPLPSFSRPVTVNGLIKIPK